MLRRAWPWSPSLRISTVFTAAASPTWRNSPPTTPQCCASPPQGMALGALPSSCAPWKTVSTQILQSLLQVWPQVLPLCALFSCDLVSDEDLSQFSMGVLSLCGKYLIFFFFFVSLWTKPGWIFLYWWLAKSFIVWFSQHTMCYICESSALKSMFRHPNKYELIFLGTEHWNFLWRSMINLRLFPAVTQ